MEKITWQTSPDGREESAMNKINEIVQWINEYEEKIIANKPPGIKSVLPFMNELCKAKQHKFKGYFGKGQEQTFKHNQITILDSEINSINREDIVHDLYRYGSDAVVQLDLTCEYIL